MLLRSAISKRTPFAGIGSKNFQRPSSGRYRFTEDRKFEIVDLNWADTGRPIAPIAPSGPDAGASAARRNCCETQRAVA